MCKVSLILPSLNVAKYMDECLQSVIRQSLRDIEIICVDAGSTDGTLDIIKTYAEQDERVQLILSDKKSYGYQMNLGMAAATGKYIGIVETDDFVPLRMFEELYTIAEREQAELVKADFYRFRTVDGRIERTYNRLDASDTYYGKVLCPAEYPHVFRMIMNTWSGIYLRSFLTENGIAHNETPGASYQDNGFWFRTFCCAKRAYFVDKPYYMNRRDNEASSVANPGKVYCMTEEWDDIGRWLRQDDKRFKAFIGVYTLRFYHSLLFTYGRIAPKFREEFIGHMSERLGALIKAGEYDRTLFTNYEWRRLNQIISDPQGYHDMMQKRCGHAIPASLLQNGDNSRLLDKLVHKVDGLTTKAELFISWVKYENLPRALRRVKWKNTVDYVSKEASHD